MKEAPRAGDETGQDADTRAHPARRLAVLIAVAVVVAIIVSAASLLMMLRDGRSTTSAGPPGPSPTATGPATTTPTPTDTTRRGTTTPTPTHTTSRPNAAEDLAPFLSAAATLDKQLHAAAAAINAAGPPWTDVGPEVARLVRAADLTPVARAIPAGLPRDLLRSVILVYSDLSSRRHAMSSFEITPPSSPHGTTEVLLSELRNGHAAAVRFDADLAATRALAARTPPIAKVPKSSRLVAEVLLLVDYVHKGNAGCDARGGAVVTELPQIRWGPVSWNSDADGTIGRVSIDGGLDFTAKFRDGTWHVGINSC